MLAVQDLNCDAGSVLECDTRCAPVYVEFWAACSAYITASLPSPALRQQFVSTQSKCHATLQVAPRRLSQFHAPLYILYRESLK